MDEIKERIKQVLRLLWQNKYRIFFFGVVLCAVFASLNY